jgi:type III secretion protein W
MSSLSFIDPAIRRDGAAMVAAVQQEAGTLRGETVVLNGEHDGLEKNREEISMAHSERAESKQFEDLVIETGSQAMMLRIEQIETYLESTRRYPDARQTADIANALRAASNPGEFSKTFANTPAQRFALLQLALARAQEGKAGAAEIQRLTDAIDELWLDSRSAILASLNTAEVAASFGGDASGVQNFDSAYADIVIGKASLALTALIVLDRLAGAGGADLGKALRALLSALGAELHATASSVERSRLQALVKDIHSIEVMVSMLQGCEALCARLQTSGTPGVIPVEVLRELVVLSAERWLAPERMRTFAEKLRVKLLAARILFFTSTKTMMRLLPTQVFIDANVRFGILDAMQKVLDEAVAEEEGLAP